MRAALVTTALVCALLGPAATASAGDLIPKNPRCEFGTRLADGAQRVAFKSRCNFAQGFLRVSPNADVRQVERYAEVRDADAGDRFRCRESEEGERVRCHGRAGAGATVRGSFAIEGDPCSVKTRFKVLGGADCSGQDDCPDVGIVERGRDQHVSGC